MLRVSFKGVWAHKLRLFLTALAIILGVGLISGVYVYHRHHRQGIRRVFLPTRMRVSTLWSVPSLISLSVKEPILMRPISRLVEGVEGVEQAFPYIQGTDMTILDSDGEVLGCWSGSAHFCVQPLAAP